MKFGDRVLLKKYKNGNRLWGTVTECWKCSGTGKVIWDYADHVCFNCDGAGWYYEKEREYTPENLAKLEAKLAKEAQRLAEEDRQRAEEQARIEAEEEARRIAEIEANRGQFVGAVGDKIQLEVTFINDFWYEKPSFSRPWEMETIRGYVFKTDDGNTLIWKTTGSLGYDSIVPDDAKTCNYIDENGKKHDWILPEYGDRITIKGTIKEHQEYRNVNQTILNRVKWIH